MKALYTWGAITLLVVASTAGDVLLSAAMKERSEERRVGKECRL